MNIQAYIQSGILESYVLGLTSAEEIAEVDSLRIQNVEIEEAINEFSLAIEQKAFETAVTPDPKLKALILALIQQEDNFVETPSISPVRENAPIVPISKVQTWKMLAAASVILLIASAALNYYLYNQYNNKNEAYQALLSDRQTLQASNQVYQTQLKEWHNTATMMADPHVKEVIMRGTEGKDNAATVFWNQQNKDVFVMINKLPAAITGKQYQLWAMVDGKPVDAGMLSTSCNSLCKMKKIAKAQAFAITLEKEGGSPTPDLKALYVIGNI